jgi:hypothetical protein
MSMTKSTPNSGRKRPATFWLTPAVSLALGAAMGAASWAGGQRGFAVFAFALMTAAAIGMIIAARRSETVAGLLDRRDERITAIDRDGTLITGYTLILAVIAGTFWQLAIGGDPQPFAWLGALAGVSYLAALITPRIRR